MTGLAWAVAFLIFDREAGRPRLAAVTGLMVVVLTVASHLWLSGPWLRQAGFPAAVHSAADVLPSPTPVAHCRAETPLSATSREPNGGLG